MDDGVGLFGGDGDGTPLNATFPTGRQTDRQSVCGKRRRHTCAATLGIGLPVKWHRWVWRQRRLEDAARLLRRTFPRLGDQLLGIVELAHHEAATGGQSAR